MSSPIANVSRTINTIVQRLKQRGAKTRHLPPCTVEGPRTVQVANRKNPKSPPPTARVSYHTDRFDGAQARPAVCQAPAPSTPTTYSV